jgi:hypothetical protein
MVFGACEKEIAQSNRFTFQIFRRYDLSRE